MDKRAGINGPPRPADRPRHHTKKKPGGPGDVTNSPTRRGGQRAAASKRALVRPHPEASAVPRLNRPDLVHLR